MKRLDWAAMMRAGIGGLKLRPDEFWRLTPAELEMMLGLDQVPRPMDRAGLERLLRTFPDQAPRKEMTDG